MVSAANFFFFPPDEEWLQSLSFSKLYEISISSLYRVSFSAFPFGSSAVVFTFLAFQGPQCAVVHRQHFGAVMHEKQALVVRITPARPN